MTTPIDISEEAGVRYLHFGSEWVQGAMRIRRPFALELAYTREMMAGLLLRPQPGWPRRALLVGLGAGSLAKFMHRHLAGTRVVVVEIEPQVVAAAQQFFRLPPQDARLRIVVADAARHLLECREEFDCILVDGFDRNARAGALDTLPFYCACRACLSQRGLLAVNLFGRSRGFKAGLERLAQAFDRRVLAFPSCDTGNVVAFAAAGEPVECSLAELREGAASLRTATGLDLRPAIARIEAAGTLPRGSLTL